MDWVYVAICPKNLKCIKKKLKKNGSIPINSLWSGGGRSMLIESYNCLALSPSLRKENFWKIFCVSTQIIALVCLALEKIWGEKMYEVICLHCVSARNVKTNHGL